MYKFGNKPPRSLESFGVAGLLDEGCQVLYDSLFNTRSLGRISDLLSVYLRSNGLDELRLRALLLFSVFEVFTAQTRLGRTEEECTLDEPLVIECGSDSEKIAVGVAFSLSSGLELAVEGLAERIRGGQPKNELERLIALLHQNADCLVVRMQPGISRVEIVSLLAIPGRITEGDLPAEAPVEIVVMQKQPEMEIGGAAKYVQLSDLDYEAMLKSRPPRREEDDSETARILAQGFSRDETETLVKGHGDEKQSETLVRGKEENGEHAKRISKEAEKLGDGTVTRIGGGMTESDAVIRMRGGDSTQPDSQVLPGDADERMSQLLTEKNSRIAKLEAQLRALQSGELPQSSAAEPGAETASAGEGEETGIAGFFKKVWPFKKKRDRLDEEEIVISSSKKVKRTEADPESEVVVIKAAKERAPASFAVVPEAQSVDAAAAAPEEAPPAAGSHPVASPPVEAPGAAESEELEGMSSVFVNQIENNRLLKAVEKIQAESGDDRNVKRWTDGLMNEVIQERARLSELAKKFTLTVRQKEIEFKNKETALNEEIRQKEETLRARNTALARAREQITTLSASLDRVRSQQTQSGSDDAHKRLAISQKVLAASREENTRLSAKIDDLKNQLAAAQAKSTKSGSATEVAALKVKNERIQRQYEQLKVANEQLSHKLTQAAEAMKSSKSSGGDEVRKKLDLSMKQTMAQQKEIAQLQGRSEKLQLRVEELEREEARLRKELAKANSDARAAKVAGGLKTPSGSKPGSGGQAA